MPEYEVGVILRRCFLQKRIDLSPTTFAEPLIPTGFKGEINNARALLEIAGHPVTREFVDRAIANFKHGTNVHGYLEVTPDLSALALSNAKVALLLSLYRASRRRLRQAEPAASSQRQATIHRCGVRAR